MAFSQHKQRVLLVGCGQLGMMLADALLHAGFDLSVLSRKERTIEGAELIIADLLDTTTLTQLPSVDMIVYMVTPDMYDEAGYRRIYVDGLNNLLESINNTSNDPLWVLISSTSVFGQTHGEWVDEASITQPLRHNGQVLLQSEQLLQEKAKSVILRFSGIYGVGRYRLISRLSTSTLALVKHPDTFTNRIHQDDCVGVIIWLLKRYCLGISIDKLYVATDSLPVTEWQLYHWLAQFTGCQLIEKAVDTDHIHSAGKRCANRRLIEQGYQFKFPTYKEGFIDVLQGFQSRTI